MSWVFNWPVFEQKHRGPKDVSLVNKDVGYLLRTVETSGQILGRVLLIIEKGGKIKKDY